MAVDRDKLNFYSEDPIDKIVAPRVRRTITNSGYTANQNGKSQTANVTSNTYTNPYGKKCFVRGRWSIDGGSNWSTFDSHIKYTYTVKFSGANLPNQSGLNLGAAVSIGVSKDYVKILTANGYHGTVTVNVNNNSESYTPTSKTFLVEYELFEIE